ncbi:hypothetical protein ASPCAL06496 [Aspergillus calidoustus]|uniref:Calcium uniporter protein, mitochondrial n=1 Tax=Aspergillus calidoustus TaxID=454130 RepID=A0A0U5G0D2_ASPCI|nr:hypothetical protein ASPCAL06496 [Aspergillus calidoustus]
MQLASGTRYASMILRDLGMGRRNIPHTHALQFCGRGLYGALRLTHVLSELQQWRRGVRSEVMRSGSAPAELGRLHTHLILNQVPYRQRMTSEHNRWMATRKSSPYEQNGAERRGEGEGKPRRETYPRDSFGQEPEKGKLLTTPSRLLKLLIPLPTDNPSDVETIAILVHSQQPLSYLERLIQAELSSIEEDGFERRPGVSFIAFQFEEHAIRPRKARSKGKKSSVDPSQEMEVEEVAVADDKGQGHPEETRPPNEELDTYSSLRQAQPNNGEGTDQRYVRWSHATEIGDFIRDAARAGEFIVAIEGAPAGLDQIRITVPSFEERTHFLRMRLRKISDRIRTIAEIKHECDKLAHRGAQRVALGGFGVLASWWYLVYKLTFETDLGWDTMEPITYLASLSTLMGGYLWFLYHNREISYRSALDFTINARQKKLYQLKGVDLQLWENLIYEANALRREIKTISADYDTEWDEKLDEKDERVIEVLKQERNQRNDKDEHSDGKRERDD